MTDEARRLSVEFQLQAGEQALRAAEALQTLGLTLDALSRLYFAALHFMKALLAWAGIEAKSHRGVHSLVGLHFVAQGKLEPALQQTFSRLETWRDKADYQEGFVGDPALLAREIQACLQLRDRVLLALQESGYRTGASKP